MAEDLIIDAVALQRDDPERPVRAHVGPEQHIECAIPVTELVPVGLARLVRPPVLNAGDNVRQHHAIRVDHVGRAEVRRDGSDVVGSSLNPSEQACSDASALGVVRDKPAMEELAQSQLHSTVSERCHVGRIPAGLLLGVTLVTRLGSVHRQTGLVHRGGRRHRSPLSARRLRWQASRREQARDEECRQLRYQTHVLPPLAGVLAAGRRRKDDRFRRLVVLLRHGAEQDPLTAILDRLAHSGVARPVARQATRSVLPTATRTDVELRSFDIDTPGGASQDLGEAFENRPRKDEAHLAKVFTAAKRKTDADLVGRDAFDFGIPAADAVADARRLVRRRAGEVRDLVRSAGGVNAENREHDLGIGAVVARHVAVLHVPVEGHEVVARRRTIVQVLEGASVPIRRQDVEAEQAVDAFEREALADPASRDRHRRLHRHGSDAAVRPRQGRYRVARCGVARRKRACQPEGQQ